MNPASSGNPEHDLPRAAWPFVEFASVLRENGFAVAPEQTRSFIASVGLLGPRSMRDIYRSALANFAPPPERREQFDALYRLVFLGQSLAERVTDDEDDEVQAFDEKDGDSEPPEAQEENESGAEATTLETLGVRQFNRQDDDLALTRLRRLAPRTLPQRVSRRRKSSRTGVYTDMRKVLREAVKRDGEVLTLPSLTRKTRQRRILLLVDVSGSMKEQTESCLRFAHQLMRSSDQMEAFTLGTRLTRVTRALRQRHREQALSSVANLVADWDGGTRLGDALQSFLSVPRFAGFVRGSLVIVLSDGLERGDPDAITDAMLRISRLAWSVLWLSPLVSGKEEFLPQTEALQAIAPYVDRFGSGQTIASLCDEILNYSRKAA